jgi:hypothetical protein
MACPYFYPVARLEDAPWAVPPRLPLGDAYTGECRCGPVALAPEDTVLRASCNSGYAHGKCDRFPNDARADAVRFNIASDSDNVIRLQYILEKGCWPVDHGDASYSVAGQAFTAPPSGEVLHRQAAAFIESYLRRAR